MRAPRGMMIAALALALTLLAAACGNDETGTPADTGTTLPPADTGTPTETGTMTETASPTDTGTETATPTDTPTDTGTPTETGTGDTASAAVSLADVCASEYADVEVPEGFSVGLVTDIGRVNDGTFNQYAFEGMQADEECFGIETNFIETSSEADYARNLETILASDPDVVVTVGFLLATDTLAAAEANPETFFIGVDQFQPEYPDNYVGILFREDQGGFLAGAMAGLLTESGVVGVVGGREDVPPVVRFVNGFEQGAKSIDESINVLSVFLPSFTDPAAGASAAQQFLGEGADVIFGAGGLTGSGAVRAATDAGVFGIGVDQDEYFTTYEGGEAPGAEFLATSAIKRVDLGVFSQIAAAVQGDFSGGIFELNAENNGITYAPFHDADVPEEAATQIEEIRAGLADGSIDTGVDPVTGLPAEG